METDLEIAYRTLNAISQGQPVPPEEVELALACVNRVIHQVTALRRRWVDMGRFLQEPTIVNSSLAAGTPSMLTAAPMVESQLH